MTRLKRRWNEQHPEKYQVSKQNVRDNAVRFRREMNNVTEANQDSTNNTENGGAGNTEWTNKMKNNLLRIEERQKSRGKGFMKRMKGAWDLIYEDKPMSAQFLRDNAPRFQKDKTLVNLIEVQDGIGLEPDQDQEDSMKTHKAKILMWKMKKNMRIWW